MTEIIDFLKRSQLLSDPYTDVMQKGLVAGQPFSRIMQELGFSSQVVTQLSLAELHGNLALSLEKVEAYLGQVLLVKKKLVEVATYPVVLLGFLVFLMLGMKNYLLPQMTDGNLATVLVGHFPSIFLGIACLSVLIILGIKIWMKRTAHLPVACFLAQLPGLGRLVKRYLTGYYAREWGNLISQGLEMPQILDIMVDQPSKLFAEIGQDMKQSLSNGQTFHEKVKDYPFFEKELSLMIEYGEAKSKLGQELTIYAQDCWDRFFTQVNQLMQLIQPLIFIFVALVIVLIYAAMLLPIYNNMEVTLS
ncbi:competence protein ComGB [Streptococcus moroccensis]|uniref:Competence protein ComGB n=1 Tax=Streptococcus moroccensis TaxID=1451356 RepID=A0ABT9YT28_9STRE|nr:competence protein ComGB [Streptococcus moroccensis]